MMTRLILLIAGAALLVVALCVAALTYVWPHFPPLDWEVFAPNLIEGCAGLGAALLAVWGLLGGGHRRRGHGDVDHVIDRSGFISGL